MTSVHSCPPSRNCIASALSSLARLFRKSERWHTLEDEKAREDTAHCNSDGDAERQKLFEIARILDMNDVCLERPDASSVDVMVWQKGPISQPLLVLPKELVKPALASFRVVQDFMADITLATLQRLRALLLLAHEPANEVLQDEMILQILKQINGHPSQACVRRGWTLLCVVLKTFPPSSLLRPSVGMFLHRYPTYYPDSRVLFMSRWCQARLEREPAKVVPSIDEMVHLEDTAYKWSFFGQPLDVVMDYQAEAGFDGPIPFVLFFLAAAIREMRGDVEEGIFRTAGSGSEVRALRERLERGQFDLGDVTCDPHVPATLFRTFVYELPEPLIPPARWADAEAAASSARGVHAFVRALPPHNRCTVVFIVCLMRASISRDGKEGSMMNADAMTILLFPLLFGQDAIFHFGVTSQAHLFVKTLLLHLEPKRVTPNYDPRIYRRSQLHVPF